MSVAFTGEFINGKDFSNEVHIYDSLISRNEELWKPTYGMYDLGTQMERIDQIDRMVSESHSGDSEYEKALEHTRKFVKEIFDLYEGNEVVDNEGSFAFVVPSRIERKQVGEYDDYASEGNQHMPLLEYVDSSTRQVFLSGQCPFIIDKYGVDSTGKRGYMVFCPLLGDIMRDIKDPNEMLGTVDKVINDTTDFAKNRLGVEVVGLGAILPRLTDMGRAIRTPDLLTTTGHGGTVWLITETIREGYEKGLTRNGELGKIGIIGSGAIGAATADTLLSRGLTGSIIISNKKGEEARLQGVVDYLTEKYPKASISGTTDNTRVMSESDAVVSAVTAQFDLGSKEWARADINGLFLVDDSQPGAFNPEQFEDKGGLLTWVMGQDNTEEGLMTLQKFDYVGTGPASKSDIFGCQAEAGSISITGRHDAAINAEVTPEMASLIGELFSDKRVKVTPAALQRLGSYISPKIEVINSH